jgi:hypothetical protein
MRSAPKEVPMTLAESLLDWPPRATAIIIIICLIAIAIEMVIFREKE